MLKNIVKTALVLLLSIIFLTILYFLTNFTLMFFKTVSPSVLEFFKIKVTPLFLLTYIIVLLVFLVGIITVILNKNKY